MKQKTVEAFALVLAWAIGGCGGAGAAPICDPAQLQDALDGASSGDIVQLGACRIAGSFDVPAGVWLSGVGDASVIEAADSYGLRLRPSADSAAPSGVESLRIESAGQVALVARGAGYVAIHDVSVSVSLGTGVVLGGLDGVEIQRLSLVGAITPDNQGCDLFIDVTRSLDAAAAAPVGGCSVTSSCTAGARRMRDASGACPAVEQVCGACGRWRAPTSTHGLYVGAVADFSAVGVSASGFADVAITLVDIASGDWRGGDLGGNLGIAFLAQDANLTLTDASIHDTFTGLRGQPSAAAFVRGSVGRSVVVDSSGMRLQDNAAYGFILSGVNGHQSGFVAAHHGDAALWVGASTDFMIDGSSDIQDSAFAGMVITQSSNVRISNVSVSGTRLATSQIRSSEFLGALTLGDGIQIAKSFDAISLTDVAITDNARAGLTVEMPSSGTATIGFDRVTVTRGAVPTGESRAAAVAGTESGAGSNQLAPGGPAGWDTGITRSDVSDIEDRAFSEPLDLAQTASPADLPNPIDLAGAVAPMG